MTNLLGLLLIVLCMVNSYYFLSLHSFRKKVTRLEHLKPCVDTLPKLSIIVPIHNEQDKLHQALSSLCQLDYADYEVIAVNDRSQDNSQSIIEQLQKNHPHLQTITVERLPEDWLGKTHALHLGLQKACGELILFTDADVVFDATVVTKAVSLLVAEELDHLTLAPHMLLHNPLMKLFLPFQVYSMLISMQPWRIHSTNPKDAIGVGAFNLVRRQSLEAIDGMQALRLNPIDDVGLARLLKKSGAKQSVADPGQLLSLNWYDSITETSLGLEKNILAYFDFSYLKATGLFASYAILFYAPWFGLFSSNPLVLAFGLINIVLVLACVIPAYREYKQPISLALLYPLSALLPLAIGVRSVFLAWLRGGIIWGGQFYSLATLKNFHNKH